MARKLPIFGTVQDALRVKRCFPFTPLILSTPSVHQSEPACACATCLLLSPPHQPSPAVSLSHESRLSNAAFPPQISADSWLLCWCKCVCVHLCDNNVTNSSGSVSWRLHSMPGCQGVSAGMNAAVVCLVWTGT